MALLGADDTRPPKPEALAFSLWHQLVAEFPNRRGVLLSGFPQPSGDPNNGGNQAVRAIVGTANAGSVGYGHSRAARVGILLCNPANISIAVKLLEETALRGRRETTAQLADARAGSSNFCSSASPCTVNAIADNSGLLQKSTLTDETLSVVAWGTYLITRGA
jgi:hypothetical protein